MIIEHQLFTVDDYLPKELKTITNPQTALPAIAKDLVLMSLIEDAVSGVPTRHDLLLQGCTRTLLETRVRPLSRHISAILDAAAKTTETSKGQLGHLADYARSSGATGPSMATVFPRRWFPAVGWFAWLVMFCLLAAERIKGVTQLFLSASIPGAEQVQFFDAIDLRGRSGLHSCGNARRNMFSKITSASRPIVMSGSSPDFLGILRAAPPW